MFTEETKHPTEPDVRITALHILTTSVRGAETIGLNSGGTVFILGLYDCLILNIHNFPSRSMNIYQYARTAYFQIPSH